MKRLESLDVMRGITLAAMIMVNNPGSWEHVYAPLRHAHWNGLTPTDLVFPFFMFMMGVSIFPSLAKYRFKASSAAIVRILRRTLSIYLVAILLNLFGNLCGNGFDLAAAFAHVRVLGVLQRLALCYLFASLAAIFIPTGALGYVAGALLAVYYVILRLTNGMVLDPSNTLCRLDFMLWGADHMYLESGLVEPEGLLGTIPSVAHTLIGFLAGKVIFGTENQERKLNRILLAGAAMTLAGFLLSYGCPLNKKVWSPTFVLVSCGMASLVLGILYWLIDIKGRSRGWGFFEAFGVNAITMYSLAAVLASVMSLHPLSEALAPYLTPCGASLACALMFVLICWIPAFILYRHRIYIKL